MTPPGKAYSFVAESAAAAVAKIRAQLGPEAVVMNVRKLPAEGLARLWQRPRIEVIACLPEPASETAEPENTPSPVLVQLEELRRELGKMRRQMDVPQGRADLQPAQTDSQPISEQPGRFELPSEIPAPAGQNYRMGRQDACPTLTAYLQSIGLTPLVVGLVEDRVFSAVPDTASRSLAEQISIAEEVLASLWRPAKAHASGLHVMIGPSGSGKTTALCKWLTQVSLVEGRMASLWRLDGVTANQAEHLSVHGEILGVPVERSWPGNAPMGDIGFADLPGVDWKDRGALTELGRVLERFGKVSVHLVLNAAYESDILLAQARAFSVLPVQDIIVTHLDEELRRGKIWNLVLGTNLPVSFLGAGQNLPGIFEQAEAQKLLCRQNPRSTGVKPVFAGLSRA